MSSSYVPLALPGRSYRSTQAAAVIRSAIKEGRWKDCLPSERRLCEALKISRPTVRAAIHQLAHDGLVEVRHGCRTRLLAKSAAAAVARNRLVVLVMTVPVSSLSRHMYQSVTDMRTHLSEHGFATEVLICNARSATAQRHKIESFVRQNPVFCCVLMSVGKELQQWFCEHKLPALVLGHCHPGVRLPSLDIDYRSVCRHAAGVLLSKGHRRIALFLPDTDVAGDLASERGFREAVETSKAKDQVRQTVARHNGTPAGIAAKLETMFADPSPPTALLIAKPGHAIWVMLFFLKRGIMVPQTVSIISRDRETLFDNAIAQYVFENEAFAHRLSHMILQLVGQGSLSLEPSLIFPSYSPGTTVRQLD